MWSTLTTSKCQCQSDKNQPGAPDSVPPLLKAGGCRAGIGEFRFHDLRHTWASWHVMSGACLQELMELGGWKSYEMVLRDAHLAPEHLSAAAQRIERAWGIVAGGSSISLRQRA